MSDIPPFDPPYITFQEAEGRITAIETLADGTTRPAPAVGRTGVIVETEKIPMPESRKRVESNRNKRSLPTGGLAPSNQQALLFLEVQFAEKEHAKKLGAKWDGTARKWYVPHGLDINLFKRWWPVALKNEKERVG